MTGDIEFNIKMKARYTKKDGLVVKFSPMMFDASTPPTPFPQSTQIWLRSIIKVAGEFNPFATAIGVGMSLRLSAVQVIKLVSGGGSSASDYGFGGEEGGYEAEENEFSGGDDAGSTEESSEDEDF